MLVVKLSKLSAPSTMVGGPFMLPIGVMDTATGPARYIPYILGLKVDADIAVFNYWWGKARGNTQMRHHIYQLELGYGDVNQGRLLFLL